MSVGPLDTQCMAATEFTTISVTPDIRDRLRSLKRGQESYSELLDRMEEQFDPDAKTRDD